MRDIFPEMKGKIIDATHFKFHVECKAKILSALNKMRKGTDFLKALSKLNFSTDKKWTQNTCKDPNVKVLMEILEEYKRQEHRPNRAAVLIPLIEYAIGLYASDLFFRERGEWFMYELVKRSPQMQFHDVFIYPSHWYPMTRNANHKYGEEGDMYQDENRPDKPPVEQEYMLWYGLDPTKDMTDIPDEIREKVIRDNRAWIERHDPALHFELTGDSSVLLKAVGEKPQ